MTDTNEIFTLEEVAEQFKFTPRQLRELINKLVKQGRIQVMRRGQAIRLDAAMIDALKEAIKTPWPSESLATQWPLLRPIGSLLSVRARQSVFNEALKAMTPSPRPKRRVRST